MTAELRYLLLTAMLTASLWIPVVIGYAKTRGPLKPGDYRRAPTGELPDWVNRANRAHMNAVESFAPFAAVVLIGRAVGVSDSVTTTAAAVFFFARLAHATVHITGASLLMARTVVFTVGWAALMAFAIELLRSAT